LSPESKKVRIMIIEGLYQILMLLSPEALLTSTKSEKMAGFIPRSFEKGTSLFHFALRYQEQT
jgi:hypothetical protein